MKTKELLEELVSAFNHLAEIEQRVLENQRTMHELWTEEVKSHACDDAERRDCGRV